MKKNNCKHKMSAKTIIILGLCCFVLLAIFSSNVKFTEIISDISQYANKNTVALTADVNTDEEKVVYLSDLDYITTNNWSYNGWNGHSITKDKNQDNNSITLRVDGEVRTFVKGIAIHGKGQATYDISEYSSKYPRFISYLGVDASKTEQSNFWIEISVSNDGDTWKSLHKTGNITPNTDATLIDVNVEGYKYLRIYVDPIGNISADHGTLGSARFVTNDYNLEEMSKFDKVKTLEYYDNILSQHDVEYNYENNYRLVLEREFVRKIGYNNIQQIATLDINKYKNLFNWILSEDNTVLEQIIEVGEISNTSKFMTILTDIYDKYKDEFAGPNSLIYTKMAVGLAATYTTDRLLTPLRFGEYMADYDYVERFTLIKQLFDNGKFMRIVNNATTGEMVPNEWFKDLHVDLIRLIMYEGMRNDEVIWLNEYTHYKKSFSDGMVPYLSPNYAQAKLYAEENRAKYNEKYLLEQYGVPYNDGIQRYWMVFEAGGICWDQSRIAQSMWRINGLPAVGAYQPGHEMYFTYYQDNNGNGYWSERYGNYGNAGTTWGGGGRVRLIFNWGAKYFTDQNIGGSKGGTSLGYLYLGQANLNNYSKYKKSVYYNLIANSYDNNEKINTYKKSLDVNNINLDTYDNLINLYKSMDGNGINSDDWYNLALSITDSYAYFPVAMYDLLKVIRPYLKDEKKLDIDRLEKEKLNAAVNVSYETLSSIGAVNAGSGVRTHARQLLGLTQPDPMSFSFDGENANKIVRNPLYQFRWAYSLDGGRTFSNDNNKDNAYIDADSVTLSAYEILLTNASNDIIIKFEGLDDYRFTIDISEGSFPSDLYASDLENRFVGTTRALEWRYNSSDKWKKLSDVQPDLTGNKSVDIKVGYTKTYLPTAYKTYTFTEDNQPDTRKYVSIDHLSVHAVSSEATNNGGPAIYALDANYNSRWHSNWGGSDSERYYTIKLDEARYISAVEFVPAGGGNGKIYDGVIYGSMDGNNWIELSRINNLTYTNACDTVDQAKANTKSFNIEDPQKVQYIKIHAARTNGNWFTARAFNLYEDITVKKAANFSFDGDNAGKIVLVDEHKGSSWTYSLDGGITYKSVSEDEHKLTDTEIDSINAENGIIIKVNGDNTEYKINIKKGTTPSINPYLNDLENRLIGLSDTSTLEWKINNGKWTSYSDSEPVVEGKSKLYVRTKATKLTAASDSLEYQFTDDNQPDTRKYVKIEHLSMHAYNSQSKDTSRPYYATNVIDGNINTMWHSTFDQHLKNEGKKAYLVIKLDTVKKISALEYIQKKYRTDDPCFIKNSVVYVSMDGASWTEAGRIENLSEEENVWRVINFNESMEAQYVKLEMETHNMFASASMINLFEDITKENEPLISSDKYQIRDNLIIIPAATTTVSTFKENVRTSQNTSFTNKKGKALSDSSKIGTEMMVTVGDTQYTLILLGDVDGNGTVNATDLSKLKLYQKGKSKATEIIKIACDIDGDGEITDKDITELSSIITGSKK